MIAGDNAHYVHSLVQALANAGVGIDLIGGNPNQVYEYSPSVKFLNLRGSQDPNVPVLTKAMRMGRYYCRCLYYMLKSDVKVVHIQAFRFNVASVLPSRVHRPRCCTQYYYFTVLAFLRNGYPTLSPSFQPGGQSSQGERNHRRRVHAAGRTILCSSPPSILQQS